MTVKIVSTGGRRQGKTKQLLDNLADQLNKVTKERDEYREALASCSETFDILLSDPDIEKNIVMVHEIRSRKSQVNKALSKAKGE